jgi:hypothetical protein
MNQPSNLTVLLYKYNPTTLPLLLRRHTTIPLKISLEHERQVDNVSVAVTQPDNEAQGTGSACVLSGACSGTVL